MNTGVCLVELACLRLLMATVEAAWRAARGGDAADVAVTGVASAILVVVGLSALLTPEVWLHAYEWTAAHAFGQSP